MNEQRTKVFLDRYAMKGEDGQPVETTPDEMFGRVALAMTRGVEGGVGPDAAEYTAYMGILKDFKFVPGGRILAGAGTGTDVTFYNCYVIPIETKVRRHNNSDGAVGKYGPECTADDPGSDSREAIIDTIGLMVDTMSRGGGVGINWSVLRPSGAHLQTINATSSGPIDWMHLASVAVGTVEQGGSRRGAAMFMLDDWHPDLLKFIDAKRDMTRILNANVSVAVSDDFMRLVEQDGEWDFVFPDTGHEAYDREWDGDIVAWQDRGYPLVQYGAMPAREVWRKLAEAAHASGEPGVVFLDRYNKQSTGLGVERLISVNPCGEQGLGAYSVCNLGAMNLAAYVVDERTNVTLGKPESATYEKRFDYEAFTKDVKTAVRFLDRAIDVNHYFIPENEVVQKRLRRIGLSVMGLADALVYLGFRYGSPEAVKFTEAVFGQMKDASIEASIELAQEFGPAPAWDDSMWQRPYLADYMERHGLSRPMLPLRNLFLLTQAPTGTTSILAGVNSGIEPFFDKGYYRTDRTGKHWVEPDAVTWAMKQPWGTKRPGAKPYGDVLVTANEVTVEEHIAMQAAVQKYVDSSVSKTINAPADQTVEEVEKAYTLAYGSGLKGLAYYRDGSRNVQVLSRKAEDFKHIDWCESTGPFGDKDCSCPETEREEKLQRLYEKVYSENEDLRERVAIQAADLDEYKRPDTLSGKTTKVRTGAGTAYVTVNRDENDVAREVFFTVGKAGSDIHGLAEGLGRLASLALRKGASLGGVANQLEGVGGTGNFNRPLAAALGRALTDMNVSGQLTAAGNAPIGSKDLLSAIQSLGSIPLRESHAVPPNSALFMGVDFAKGLDRSVAMNLAGVLSPADENPLEADEDYTVQQQEERAAKADLCPECGNVSLVRQEGCAKCRDCGYSAC